MTAASQLAPPVGVALDAGEPAVTRYAATMALAAFAGAVLLNVHHIAWWTLPLVAAMLIWRGRASWRTHQLPSRAVRMVLVALLTAGVLASFRTLNGLAAGSTLMVAMGAAKLMETRKRRDWHVNLAVSLFLLLAAGLDAQQLWRLPLYAGALWLVAATLYAFGSGTADLKLAALLRHSGRGLLYALPVALLLFTFFPRIPGAFWAMAEETSATTGLADSMSPGSISQLSESDATALRVRFDGPLPPPELRYWRGPVLHDFDGYTWRRAPGQVARQPPIEYLGTAYEYQVTQEAAEHNVFITLEMPARTSERWSRLSFDYQLLSTRPLNSARIYSVTSYPEHRYPEELSLLGRRVDLRLPDERNRRSRQLALEWRTDGGNDAAFVARALQHFKDGGFEYTLTPPLLDRDSVDDFLFNSKRGFCGHYASAFVTLMRAGGVPARVITGYLGGEWNPVGGYLLIRQSHAHAWAEVWLDGRGWTRVDPTAVVAPERLRRDIFDLLPNAARSTERVLRGVPGVASLMQAAAALNAWWQDRIIGFDFRQQTRLLDWLGLDSDRWEALALILAGGALLWAAWLIYQLRDQLRPARRDAARRLWQRFEGKLARVGHARAPHEGPLGFATRVATQRPRDAAALIDVARRYADLRYGPPGGDERLRALRAAITQLRLPGA